MVCMWVVEVLVITLLLKELPDMCCTWVEVGFIYLCIIVLCENLEIYQWR